MKEGNTYLGRRVRKWRWAETCRRSESLWQVEMVLGILWWWRWYWWCRWYCDDGDGASDTVMMEMVEVVLGILWWWRRWRWCWGYCDDADGGGGAGRGGGDSVSSCSYGRAGKMLVIQVCPTLCDPRDRRLPGSPVHEILQGGILGWAAIPFSRASSWLSDWNWWWWWCFQLFIWKDREDSGDYGEGKSSPSTVCLVTRLTKEPVCVGGKGGSEILKSEKLHHLNVPKASCWLPRCPCAAGMHIQTIWRPHPGWYFPLKQGEEPSEPEMWGQVWLSIECLENRNPRVC